MPKRIIRKLTKKSEEPKKVERITNETVSEHRAEILAGGRKFKYPVQYTRHKLVINSILIFLFAAIVTTVFIWWQLYLSQNTGSFLYRTTQLLPLPVAKVDEEPVLYRDYLMEYRSSVYWLEQKSQSFEDKTRDGKRQAMHYKRLSLDKVERESYARKLAKDKNITVSSKEIDEFIRQALVTSNRRLSYKAYESVLSNSFGVTNNEYRLMLEHALLVQKVSFDIDKNAKTKAEAAKDELKKGQPFDVVFAKYSDELSLKETSGNVGFVPINNQDQGVTRAAAKLKPNQISDLVKTPNGYYIVKLIEKKENQVQYARIHIPLTVFEKQFEALKKQNKIKEYISVKEDS